ncbi:MAG TPA: hypothetical protein VK358_06075 [Longimicrobium sp.]|nr:hypothetical protein [Longimicrobium sp.]
MKKLHLDLEALVVDSFAPADVEKATGTVQAYAAASTNSYLRPCFYTEQAGCPTI